VTYFNCGAYGADGKRIPTKKQLRAEMADHPGEVYFDGTALVKDVGGYRGDDIPDGAILSVVGPNPYESRKWYASVRKTAEGSAKVS